MGNKRVYKTNNQDGTLTTQLWFIQNIVITGFQWTVVHLAWVLTTKSHNPIFTRCVTINYEFIC
jgi:hypothetical protein